MNEEKFTLKPQSGKKEVFGYVDVQNTTDRLLRIYVRTWDSPTGRKFEVIIKEPDAFKAPPPPEKPVLDQMAQV